MVLAASLGPVLLLGGLFAIGELMAWPWLAEPMQRSLTRTLGRSVKLTDPTPQAAAAGSARIHRLGGLRLESPRIEVGAPVWSSAPFLLRAKDVVIDLRYTDLWRAYRGQRLHIQGLQAAELEAHLERLADGRASWQLGLGGKVPAASPQFELLQVGNGTLHYRDAIQGLDTLLALKLIDGGMLSMSAKGSYRTQPLQAELKASSVLPWVNVEPNATPVQLSLRATVGRAELQLQGSAVDVLQLRGLNARFNLNGPSLAAVGDPLGVTLPTTGPFRVRGSVHQNGPAWDIQVDQARIGATALRATLRFEPELKVPLLWGRLSGSRLALADLGPALGTTAAVAAPAQDPAALSASTSTADQETAKPIAPTLLPASTRGRGRVLPNRPFDLAALRKMDADVQIAIDEVDANTTLLAPLRPLRAHLRLQQGQLSLQELDARMGGGRLSGTVQLDGRANLARWETALNWQAVQLEQWLRLPRKGDAPPFVTGYLNGSANLTGVGRSTAEILASLNGRLRAELKGGSISHLVVEAAGLDLAESLGLLIKGDEPLAVHCAVADLRVQAGVLRPQVLVMDTSDSTIFLEGTASLDQETLALQAIVSPKDFSPLTLRSPLHLQGTFAKPEFVLAKGRMGAKLAAAVLLGLLSPVAALLPLLDPGDTDAAEQDRAGCAATLRPAAKMAKP